MVEYGRHCAREGAQELRHLSVHAYGHYRHALYSAVPPADEPGLQGAASAAHGAGAAAVDARDGRGMKGER